MSRSGWIIRETENGGTAIVQLDDETGEPSACPRPEILRTDGDVVEVSGEGAFRISRSPRGWTLELGAATFELRTEAALLLQNIDSEILAPTED